MSSHLRAVTKSSFAVHCVYVKLASLVFLLNCLLLICLSAYCLLLILLIVRGHSPVISFRYRFVVFCLSFPSLASCFRCLLRGLQFLSSFRSFVLLRCSSLVFVPLFLLFIVVGSRAAVLSRGLRSSPQHRLLSSSFRCPASGCLLLLRRRLLFLQSLSSSVSERPPQYRRSFNCFLSGQIQAILS